MGVKQEAVLAPEIIDKLETDLHTKKQCDLLPCKRVAVALMQADIEVSLQLQGLCCAALRVC